MKKIYYGLIGTTLVVTAISCNKPKPLFVYKLVIERTERSVGGNTYSAPKNDTIMALDDTLAYQKGIVKYYSNLVAEALVPSAGYQTNSFSVTDTSGIDVSVKLPQKIMDSLNVMTKGFAEKQIKRTKRQ